MANFDHIGEFGLGQILTKRLTTPGGAVAPTVAPEVFPVLTLENDRPEWGWLKGELRCKTFVSVAQSLGNFSVTQLYLPTTSRSLAVVTRITTRNNSSIGLYRLVGIGGGIAGWAGTPKATCDFRANGENCQLILEQVQPPAPPAAFVAMSVLNVAQSFSESPIIIAPGTSLGVMTNVTNVALQYEVEWYERPAEPGELF